MAGSNWIGYGVSVQCGEPLGCYQGTIMEADGSTITLTKAFRNGFPYPKPQVTLNAADIKELRIIEPKSEKSEKSHSTIAAVGKCKTRARASVSDILRCSTGAEDGQAAPAAPTGPTPGKKERARRRNEACFGPEDDAALLQDFDFEKNLALFDKRAIWEQLRHSHKPDLLRQTDGCGGPGGRFRHDENVLEGLPVAHSTIIVPEQWRAPVSYVTDEGAAVPGVTAALVEAVWARLAAAGLQRSALELLARAAADLVLRLVGGGRRLDARNAHQRPTVVVLAERHRSGVAGVSCARLLAAHGVRVFVVAPAAAAAPGAELHEPLQQYLLTGEQLLVVEGAGCDAAARLPTAPDLLLLALSAPGGDGAQFPSGVVEWARGVRGGGAVALEPGGAEPALEVRASLMSVLPRALSAAAGKLYLCNVAVPARLLADLGLRYRPPYAASHLLALHPAEH